MRISKISDNKVNYLDDLNMLKSKLQKTEQNKTPENVHKNESTNIWKKDILMQGLEKLEKNIQLDNSRPLDRAGREPIESFPEAVIELHLLNTPNFKTEAYGAQANIRPESIASLFMGEVLV
jgi:hypothetical protein